MTTPPPEEAILRKTAEALFQLWRHKRSLPPGRPHPSTGEMMYPEEDFIQFYQECQANPNLVGELQRELDRFDTMELLYQKHKRNLPYWVRQRYESLSPEEKERFEEDLKTWMERSGHPVIRI